MSRLGAASRMRGVTGAPERQRELVAAYRAVFALDEQSLLGVCTQYFDAYPSFRCSGEDIVDFGAFMRERLDEVDSLPPYSSDLVRFVHVLQQERFAPGPGCVVPATTRPPTTLRDRPARVADVVVERFSYNITEIEAALREGREPDPREQEEHVVYGRRPTDGEPVVLRVSAAVAILVDLCDGTQALGAVIAAATATCLRPVMAPAALSAVDRLIGIGVFEMPPAHVEPPR